MDVLEQDLIGRLPLEHALYLSLLVEQRGLRLMEHRDKGARLPRAIVAYHPDPISIQILQRHGFRPYPFSGDQLWIRYLDEHQHREFLQSWPEPE